MSLFYMIANHFSQIKNIHQFITGTFLGSYMHRPLTSENQKLKLRLQDSI